MNPVITIPYRITREYIQAHREYTFLYGQDYQQKGALGQAWFCVGEPNTFPVFTLYRYCANPEYFKDCDLHKSYIGCSFWNIPSAKFIIPFPKIGEGCSRMREYAPNLLKLIKQRIEWIRYPNIRIDYGTPGIN